MTLKSKKRETLNNLESRAQYTPVSLPHQGFSKAGPGRMRVQHFLGLPGGGRQPDGCQIAAYQQAPKRYHAVLRSSCTP